MLHTLHSFSYTQLLCAPTIPSQVYIDILTALGGTQTRNREPCALVHVPRRSAREAQAANANANSNANDNDNDDHANPNPNAAHAGCCCLLLSAAAAVAIAEATVGGWGWVHLQICKLTQRAPIVRSQVKPDADLLWTRG